MTDHEPRVSRRTVLNAAWAAPVVVAAVAAPSAVASPGGAVSLAADTSSQTQLTVFLTSTETLPAGLILTVDIESTPNQWAITGATTLPSGWQTLSERTRGSQFVSISSSGPGTYTFVLGVAGIAAYEGMIITVRHTDGQLLASTTV